MIKASSTGFAAALTFAAAFLWTGATKPPARALTGASASSAPATVTLSKSTRYNLPPGNVAVGYMLTDYTARVINHSERPLWLYCWFDQWPAYRLFMRPAGSDHWTDETVAGCSLGAEFRQIAPGNSLSFEVIPLSGVRGQFFVKLPIYSSPSDEGKTVDISSEAISIK